MLDDTLGNGPTLGFVQTLSQEDLVERFLEGRISPDDYATLTKACTAGWDPAFVASETSKEAVEEVVFKRHDNTVRFVVPWVNRIRPIRDCKIIDFGSGCGSSALAFSHFARDVAGFEIASELTAAFDVRMRVFGRDNVRVTQAAPENILAAAVAEVDESTSILLNAVVEHLTEREQIDYLRTFWEALAPGELLIITETPNYHAVTDTHTFGICYAHTVPDELFVDYLKASPPSLRFRAALLETLEREGKEALLLQRRRLGLPVTHHVFELAFGRDLNEIVVGDGFDEAIVNWFPITTDDRLLLQAHQAHDLHQPIGFCRSVLSFVFRKPASQEDVDQAREWNRRQRAWVREVHLPPPLPSHADLPAEVTEDAMPDCDDTSGEPQGSVVVSEHPETETPRAHGETHSGLLVRLWRKALGR